MVTQSRINEADHEINDLAFAEDIALLENNATRAKLQLDVLKHNALQVALEINIDKTVQMRVNMNDQIHNSNLVVNGQPFDTIGNLKCLICYIDSTKKK